MELTLRPERDSLWRILILEVQMANLLLWTVGSAGQTQVNVFVHFARNHRAAQKERHEISF